EALGNLGLLLKEVRRDYDGAIREFREAIRFMPADVRLHLYLGNALALKGQADEAIAVYRVVIRLDPGHVAARRNLGALLCDVKRDYDGAFSEFRAAIDLAPRDATLHYNLGVALAGKGRVDEAIDAYREAIRFKPDYAEAHCNLARQLESQGRYGDALAVYE